MDRIIKFINYWYFRYLLVTELFMVEKWERVMIHIVLFIMLGLISIFNTTVVLGLTSWTTQLYFGDKSTLTTHDQGVIQHGEL